MTAGQRVEADWLEAAAAGRRLLEGATRWRAPGASDAVELAVLDWGPGEGERQGLALLHHANGFCAAVYAPVAVGLRARGFHVVAVDARGHGDSTPVAPGGDPDPYAWNTLADDLLGAMPTLFARTGHQRVSLGLGHSFGGALLLRAAVRRPEAIERLLLCDPVILPPRAGEPGERDDDAPGGSALAEATRRRRDRFPSREAAWEHCRTRGLFADFTPEALALYVEEGMRETAEGGVALKCHREVEAAIFDGGARSGGGGATGRIEGLADVAAEVLLVHAARGNFSLPYYRTIAAELPRGRVESHDLAHLFPLEQPDRTLALVDALLAG